MARPRVLAVVNFDQYIDFAHSSGMTSVQAESDLRDACFIFGKTPDDIRLALFDLETKLNREKFLKAMSNESQTEG